MTLAAHYQWRDQLPETDWEALSALYRAAPLGEKSAAHLQTVFGNSRYRCFVYDGERVIAAGRALADGLDCSYLCDVAVLPAYQGQGLGRAVVARLLALSHGHKKIILYAVPGKEPLYRRLGFMRMTTAMAVFHDQMQALERGLLSES